MPLTTSEKYIAQLQSPSPTLRSISLAGNDLTSDNVEAFSAALLGNKSVSYLAMFCVTGGDTSKGATLLAASAMSLSSLRTLSWSNMFEGGNAIRILAQGLRSSKTLNRVLLMDSKLKSNDILLLADALQENNSIETMGLECCGLTDEGAVVMAKMVKKNKALHTLSLGENGITDIGAQALLESIFDTKSLNSIWMSNHTITSFSRECAYPGDDNSIEQFCHVSLEMQRKLNRILDINRSSNNQDEVGRHKIALHMEEDFDSSWIEEIDEKLMPHMLSWCGRTASFEILRNMPSLLSSCHQQTIVADPHIKDLEKKCEKKAKSGHFTKISRRFARKVHPEHEEKQNSSESSPESTSHSSGSTKFGVSFSFIRVVNISKGAMRLRKGNSKSKRRA